MQCQKTALNNSNNGSAACTSAVGGRRVEGDGRRISKMMQASDLSAKVLDVALTVACVGCWRKRELEETKACV